MKLTKWLIAGLICATAVASDAPQGTVPRASADKYTAHAEREGITVGAVMLTSKQARVAFSSEVNRCCLVVEVALYPKKDGLVEVSLNDFALRDTADNVAVKPSSAEVVAGKLQRQAQPDQGGRDVTITPVAGVGYESGGIDPITGQRRSGGVVTSTGVGVGVGAPPQPKPGSTDADRRTMELELREKGLPAGNTATPVAGYLYFSMPRAKRNGYQLEYTLNGDKVVLPLLLSSQEGKKSQ
jgi:hypothetical protein